jgi:YegS/Rv2252/BmrU family lipid kinase
MARHQKIQVIINPESDRGRTKKRWQRIKEALRYFFREFNYTFTEKPLQATEISRNAVKEGSDLIVGVGGDGTINEIANGFFDGKKLINHRVSLGIIPSGTGCDFIRSLNIPLNLRRALETISEATVKKIDVGLLKFTTASGEQKERFFVNVGDFGIGGEVVARMERLGRKRKASSYFQSLLQTFFQYRNKKLRLILDGQELPPDEYMVGAVANGKIFGKGMKIAPEAELDDGFFDVILVKGMKAFEFLRNVWKIYTGSHLTHPKIAFYRARQVEVLPLEKNDKVLIEIDGEQVGLLPASFEIIHRILPIKGR